MEVLMFPGGAHYPEGSFEPARGYEHNWHVWCTTGALRVLKTHEFEQRLAKPIESAYTIHFSNGSAARIKPGDELWAKLQQIAETYNVEVFPVAPSPKYIAWTGTDMDLGAFDAIKISRKVR